jgi:hypothetical protein
MNLTKHKKMTLAQSHVETFENTVLHKVAVTTNPREGTKIMRLLSQLKPLNVTTNPREGTKILLLIRLLDAFYVTTNPREGTKIVADKIKVVVVNVTTNPREGTKIGQGIGRIRRFGCYN